MFKKLEDIIPIYPYDLANEVRQMLITVDDSVCASFDNDEQVEAYHMGIFNTLSALNSLLHDCDDSDLDDEEDCDDFYGEWVFKEEEISPTMFGSYFECSVCGFKTNDLYMECPVCDTVMKNGGTV